MRETRLFSKIYGAMIGGAIGDALGGPVEGPHYREIERRYGVVDRFLPYHREPSEHAQFTNHPGSHTDDTRLHWILCQAVIAAGGDVNCGDFARALADYYHECSRRLERSFNDELVHTAVGVARKHQNCLAIREELYKRLLVSPLGSEVAQTLAVALGMVVAAEGDFRLSVVGAVNYGRDNDSYAAVAGASAGALKGADGIPAEWIETVHHANPEPDIRKVSLKLSEFVAERFRERSRNHADVERLLAGSGHL